MSKNLVHRILVIKRKFCRIFSLFYCHIYCFGKAKKREEKRKFSSKRRNQQISIRKKKEIIGKFIGIFRENCRRKNQKTKKKKAKQIKMLYITQINIYVL